MKRGGTRTHAGNASRGSQSGRALVRTGGPRSCHAVSAKSRTSGSNDGLIAKAEDYACGLAKLHVKLIRPQPWVVKSGITACILFEGRDGAGGGGTIKVLTERGSPRIIRVAAHTEVESEWLSWDKA